MGRKAFELFYEELQLRKKGEKFTPKIIEVETSLVVRDST
jgi:DNA-binding LacI/PurR family transcriptional regulator